VDRRYQRKTIQTVVNIGIGGFTDLGP